MIESPLFAKSSAFSRHSAEEKIYWILRITCAFCFIGHGAWGIITKSGWLPFFNVFKIPPDTAYQLMPVVGTMDIMLGLTVLFHPVRAVLLYMTFWCIFTAMLRPLAGMGGSEFLERAGNYGAPLIFLMLSGYSKNFQSWFTEITSFSSDKKMRHVIYLTLKILIGLLLIGHGGYGAIHHKAMLINQFKSAGLLLNGMDPILFITTIGYFEILMGMLMIIIPRPPLLLVKFILCWKVGTEFLYVIHGPAFWEIWEFIERWGNYGLPLVLILLHQQLYPKIKKSKAS